MTPLLSNIGSDKRCDSHATVLAVRDGKEGWFELYCPGGIACYDDGELHCVMVRWKSLFLSSSALKFLLNIYIQDLSVLWLKLCRQPM